MTDRTFRLYGVYHRTNNGEWRALRDMANYDTERKAQLALNREFKRRNGWDDIINSYIVDGSRHAVINRDNGDCEELRVKSYEIW